MTKRTHPLVLSARKGMTPQINLLRRALIEARGEKGLTRVGRSLAGGRHLINTFTSAQKGEVNVDRYKRSHIEPAVEAGFSFILDISGSMDDKIDPRKRGGPTIMQSVIAVAIALADVCDKLGVAHRVAGCDVEQVTNWRSGLRSNGSNGATAPNFRGVLYPFSNEKGKGLAWEERALMRFPANGSTYIATYAEEALRQASLLNAKNRIAVYMTDGDCSSTSYLHSIEEQARARGITLVGVVMGNPRLAYLASQHPNGVFASSSEELGKVILGHLAKAIKG